MYAYCQINLVKIRFVPRILVLLCLSLLLLNRACPALAQGSKIRVALFVGRGAQASEFKKEFKRSNDDDIVYETVVGQDIRSGSLNHFDALLVPGGSAKREALSMGLEARDEVRRFVNEGGIYMGVCAGAYLSSEQGKLDLGLLPLTTIDSEHWYRVDDMTKVDVELTAAGMEVFGIKKPNIRINYENGPIFALPKERSASFCPLGFFRSEVVGDGGERGAMLGAPAMVIGKYGRGVVLVLSPHPEETPGIKQVELHALRWLYKNRSAGVEAIIASSAKNENSAKNVSSTSHPATSHLGEKALQLAESIFDRAQIVRYTHKEEPAARQVITQPDGTLSVRTDCSGFISYIVDSIGPRHYQVVRERESQASYPQAKVWARFFATLDSNQAHDGWLGISNWRDLSPGDFIAWVEGKSSSGNTGHVMMVMGRPSEIRQENGICYFEIQVIDSSSVYHFAPEKLPPHAGQQHRNGLGEGCVRIVLSKTNEPIGYWAGTYWGEGNKPVKGPTLDTLVSFARMTSLIEADK